MRWPETTRGVTRMLMTAWAVGFMALIGGVLVEAMR